MSVSAATSRTNWLLFLLLGFMWGSSYLFIKIGVDAGLQPMTLIAARLLIGAALLATVVGVAREPLPRGWRAYAKLSVLGFFGIALPFYLITWAEATVDSALAAVLVSPVPIFVIPFAALLLRDERLTLAKLVGVVVGLVGVALLVGFDPASIGRADFTAELALIGATISYAFAGVYARKFITGYRPMIPALFEVGTALMMIGVLALAFERPWEAPVTFNSVLAVVWLGLFGSGLAFVIFFRLINQWGATRTSLVAYLMPVWGIALGAAILGEPVTWSRICGTALVIGGIALVNVRLDQLTGALSALRGRDAPEAKAAADAVMEQR